MAAALSDKEIDRVAKYFLSFVQVVPEVTREAISRVRNCILALARYHVMLFDTSVVYAYDISLEHKVPFL